MGTIGPMAVSVIASVIGLAMVAVLMSQRAQTPQVLQAGGGALAQVIGAAVSPIAGSANTAYGSANYGGGSIA